MRYTVQRDPRTGVIILVTEDGKIFTGAPDPKVPVKAPWWCKLWAWLTGG